MFHAMGMESLGFGEDLWACEYGTKKCPVSSHRHKDNSICIKKRLDMVNATGSTLGTHRQQEGRPCLDGGEGHALALAGSSQRSCRSPKASTVRFPAYNLR